MKSLTFTRNGKSTFIYKRKKRKVVNILFTEKKRKGLKRITGCCPFLIFIISSTGFKPRLFDKKILVYYFIMVQVGSFEELVSLINDRLDIVDVVSQFVALKKSGANYWGLCPFHSDKKPSMSVSPSKGIYKCFSCGAGGNALNFLIKIQNRDFKDVVFELADKFGFELPKKHAGVNENKNIKKEMLSACKIAADFYHEYLFNNDARIGMDLLKKRDITEEIIRNYNLGFAPNKYDTLYKLLKKDYTDEVLEKAGLILKSNNGGWIDRFRNRIIIPIRNENGECVAFGARAVKDGEAAKYLNSAESLIYNKSKILYGMDKAKDAIKEQDGVIIMEGYFDVISAQAHGVTNAVGSCGTALTPEHVRLISRYTKSRRIYLSFDTDKAGINATKRGSAVIKETLSAIGNVKQFDESHISSVSNDKYACEIRVISPPQGKDPDEFIRTMGGEAFLDYAKNAPLLIDFLLNNTLKNKNEAKTPQEKAELVNQIIDILKDVNNKIIQTEYVKMVSGIIDVDEKALLKELVKAGVNDEYHFSVQENKNVTKSSQLEIKAQKNLLSVFLSADSPLSYMRLNELLPENIIHDEKLIIVKNTIDKISCTINNVRELTKELYTKFIEDDSLTQILTELITYSEAFSGLDSEEFEKAVKENISKLNRLYQEKEKKELQQKYKQVNDDEIEALKMQMQLRDKLKLRTGD